MSKASEMANFSPSKQMPPRAGKSSFNMLLDAADALDTSPGLLAEIKNADIAKEEQEKPATLEAVADAKAPKGKSDLRRLKKQPQLDVKALKVLPQKILRELFSVPQNDLYSNRLKITCAFYEDGRCSESFNDFRRQDRVLRSMEKHIKEHIVEEERKGEEFTTSSVQYRDMIRVQKDAKTKKPKASPPHNKDNSPQPRKKPAARKRKRDNAQATTEGSLQEGEKAPKKRRNPPSISTKQDEDKGVPEGEVLTEGGVTDLYPHLSDHTYAAAPGTKPRKEDPASPTTSESGSFASEVSGISLETDGPNEDDSQSVLSGDPFAAHEETVSQAQERRDADRVRIFTRRRAIEPKSPEEKARAMHLLDLLKSKKKQGNKLECELCPPGRTFTAMASYANHVRSQHAGIKQYQCNRAGCTSVGFTRKNSLKYHIAMHEGKYEYECPHCDKRCRHKSHFEEHMRKHTGKTPYECQFCDNKYKTRNTFKRHLRTAHGMILTQHGLFTMTEEEYEKVRTKTYKKTSTAKVNSSPSNSGGSSSSSPKRENDSPACSATAVLPPVGTLLSGLNSMTPTLQPCQGFVHYPSVVYPPVPITLVQTATMPPVTFGVNQSGAAQVVFINDCATMMNLGSMASSQPSATQTLITNSQQLICSLQPLAPSQQLLVPASQPSATTIQTHSHNNQSVVANLQLPVPTSESVVPGPQFLVASSVSSSQALNPNFQPPLPRS